MTRQEEHATGEKCVVSERMMVMEVMTNDNIKGGRHDTPPLWLELSIFIGEDLIGWILEQNGTL